MSVITPRRPVGRQGGYGDLVDEGRFFVPCPEATLTLAGIYEGL